MITTIVLPISRDEYVNRIFANLELLKCDTSKTNLLVIVDAKEDVGLFLKCRNLTSSSKFNEKLCFFYDDNTNDDFTTINGRRFRISNIHNQIRSLLSSNSILSKSDYIFGIEDDTLFPSNTLISFLQFYSLNPSAGFIEGVELGRHSDTYVGAWRVNDIYKTSSFISLSDSDISGETIPIDTGGLYCFLTKYSTYIEHVFKPYENNALGPDANFGITLRREGYSNYIDTSIMCTHLSGDNKISYPKDKVVQIEVFKNKHGWSQRTLN